MSFTSDTKKELTQLEPDKKCCMLAEIAGFLRFAGSIVISEGRMDIKVSTENPAVARLFITMIKSYFGAKSSLSIGEAAPLSKGRSYELIIGAEMNAEQILREVGILGVKEGGNYITEGIDPGLIKKRCCKKAMIRGIFLAAGSISDPDKGYHLEIVCAGESIARDVKKLINSFGLKSKYIFRKSRYVVYIKECEQIIDFLNILGAHGQLFRFENVRITKELRNKTNRISNCDNANFDRTLNASQKQLADIRIIEEAGAFHSLPGKLKETALLRIANPELSLIELAELFRPPLKKSGLNHRLKKLEMFANQIKESKGIKND
ncbi:MAG: DNA-binding protein WhiA [Clostridia bacterium]|nr:DNA-binding protein WhiA [Clostridia bacterium]